ncbi:conjugal transfer protein TraN [Methylomonas sp. AM2-LC]|uniref:conjugal transfer protein TraN n=1 Tax=Methylomonas sp. AM2-LC TaxID=3153301 RepID=UPI003267CC5F
MKKIISGIVAFCLLHNSIAAFYISARWLPLMSMTPISAIADVITSNAAEGQSTAATLLKSYQQPTANTTTGTITLKNGQASGQTLQQNQLFQNIKPGAMNSALNAYGSSSAQGTVVNNTLSSVQSGSDPTSLGYQTIAQSFTPTPDMSGDAIWKQSDSVLSQKSPLINDLFNGCSQQNTYTSTNCTTHVPKYQTCLTTLPGQNCTVSRSDTFAPVITMKNGNGSVSNCGVGCTRLWIGYGGTLGNQCGGCCQYNYNFAATFNVLRPGAITSAVITNASYDDFIQVFVNGQHVYTGSDGWNTTCDTGRGHNDSPNKDITKYFTNTAPGGTITIDLNALVGNLGNGNMWINVYAAPDITDTLVDYPPGCRARLNASWPPPGNAPGMLSTGNATNDVASTSWWTCNNAVKNYTVGPYSGPGLYPYMQPLLPGAPNPPPVCLNASMNQQSVINGPCYTDYQGYQQCPKYSSSQLQAGGTTCSSLGNNPSCKWISNKCISDANGNPLIDATTGTCLQFVETYDCGDDVATACNTTNSQTTICDSKIRCIGGECVDPATEANNGFVQAATALQILNQAQRLHQNCTSASSCILFNGQAYECQMANLSVLGSVDCCNMPIQGSWINYLQMASYAWELTDTSVDLYAMSEYGKNAVDMLGAWKTATYGSTFDTTLTSAQNAFSEMTQPFTSMMDSVTSSIGLDSTTSAVESTVSSAITGLEQSAMQGVADWVGNTFGAQAAQALFSYSTSPTTDATGKVLTEGTVSGISETLASIIDVVGIIYAIYQIAQLVVQLIFACTKDELQLNMLRNQKMCTSEGEIGTYCSDQTIFGCIAVKEAFCCYSSPFARIFEEQARPQLGLNFGTPKAPICSGLSVQQISQLDFSKMDFSEWIGMISQANLLALNKAQASGLYNMNALTSSNLPSTTGPNAQTSLQNQTSGTNVDVIRQYLLNNLQ